MLWKGIPASPSHTRPWWGGTKGGIQRLLQVSHKSPHCRCRVHTVVWVGCQPAPMGCLWGSRGCASPKTQPCGLHVITAWADGCQRWHRALGQTPMPGQAGSVTLA